MLVCMVVGLGTTPVRRYCVCVCVCVGGGGGGGGVGAPDRFSILVPGGFVLPTWEHGERLGLLEERATSLRLSTRHGGMTERTYEYQTWVNDRTNV